MAAECRLDRIGRCRSRGGMSAVRPDAFLDRGAAQAGDGAVEINGVCGGARGPEGAEEVTGNVAMTARYFGISRQVY